MDKNNLKSNSFFDLIKLVNYVKCKIYTFCARARRKKNKNLQNMRKKAKKTDSLCETAGLGQCCVPLSAVSASNCSS